MVTKKVVYKTKWFNEAVATKKAIDNLNKRLGKRERAKIRRTKNLEFEVLN